MTFWTLANIATITRGEWLREPADADATCAGVSIDTREILTNRAFLAIKGERHDAHDHLRDAANGGAALLIIERNVAADALPNAPTLLVDSTRRALIDLAFAYRGELTKTRVIAVTGSCGKTTTTRLLDGVLSQSLRGSASPKSFNNDIGVPLTMLAADPDDDYLILEIGTNAPGEISALGKIAQPDVAIITTVGEAHLHGLGSIDAIGREKSSLLECLRPNGIAIVNADVPALRSAADRDDAIWFGESSNADVLLSSRTVVNRSGCVEQEITLGDGSRFTIALSGRHNALNALAVIACARHLEVGDGDIAAGLRACMPAAMRFERCDLSGLTLINDAYNANPQSMRASIDAFLESFTDAPRRVLILGEMRELGSETSRLHRDLLALLREAPRAAAIDQIIVIGPAMCEAASGLKRVRCFEALSETAITFILTALRMDDAVLIKGSRGVALERIIDALRERFAARNTISDVTLHTTGHALQPAAAD